MLIYQIMAVAVGLIGFGVGAAAICSIGHEIKRDHDRDGLLVLLVAVLVSVGGVRLIQQAMRMDGPGPVKPPPAAEVREYPDEICQFDTNLHEWTQK
jgi:hypothetical protein